MVIGNCPVCGADMRVGSDMTNADRIRSMTDEELADWIYGQSDEWSNWCPREAPINPETLECLRNGGDCGKCILDWLKEEAKE